MSTNRIARIADRSRMGRIKDVICAAFVAGGIAVMAAAAIPAGVAAAGPAPVKAPCVDVEYTAASQIAEPDQVYLAACDDNREVL